MRSSSRYRPRGWRRSCRAWRCPWLRFSLQAFRPRSLQSAACSEAWKDKKQAPAAGRPCRPPRPLSETPVEGAPRFVADDRPDAIFCANDLIALGATDAIRSRTPLRVPEDVLVAGFDDIPMAGWAAYD
ncbi:MAG: substrate-binding domain-containing protein [Hyphomicrobiales bacterium]|nr:substrate-binding domain-containing protein [Hyphomicrobiales bacterium]